MSQTTHINKNAIGMKKDFEVGKLKNLILREKGAMHLKTMDAICGKLEFYSSSGDSTIYNVVANGCVMVFLTDCNGNIEAGSSYECVIGNRLSVEGCHAFGCSC